MGITTVVQSNMTSNGQTNTILLLCLVCQEIHDIARYIIRDCFESRWAYTWRYCRKTFVTVDQFAITIRYKFKNVNLDFLYKTKTI